MGWIGIDPGKTGCIASLTDEGKITTIPFKESLYEIATFLRLAALSDQHCFAVLERVRSSPQMGVTSAFTFGTYYGFAKMGLIAAGIRFVEVSPQKWQSVMDCRTGGNKNITKQVASQYHPELKVTHITADAILLAEFARKLDQNRKGSIHEAQSIHA